MCIQFAEMRIFREADVAAYRKTVDVTLSANNQFLDLPQDLYVTRYIKTKTGEFLKEKDQTFIREFSQNDSAGVAALQGTPQFYALYGEGAYSASDRGMKWQFSPRADVDYTLEIGYTILPTGLSGSNANSYLGDYAPDLLLYACLLEAAAFMKSPGDQGSRYQALDDRALQTFIGQEQVRKRTDEFVSGETGPKGL